MDNVLYSNGLVFSVLGNLSNNPQLFHEKSDVLKEDLFLNDFHKVVFNAIQTMTYSSDNATEISVLDVDTYLKAYPTYYKTWEANNGVDFLNDAKNNANVSLFDSGVDTLNKYLLLRTYDAKGIDIHDLYRYDGSDEERNQDAKTLQGMSVSDITEYFTQKVIDVRENFDSGDDGIVKFDLKDDIESLVSRLSEEPEMGLPFSSPIYNWLFRGMRGGKYMLRSAESGSGKAFATSTLIPLPDGSNKPAGDVKVGDMLIDRKGNPTKVLNVFPQPKHMLYKVTTSDGREQILHPNHLMSVWSYGQKKYNFGKVDQLLTKPLSEIMKDYKKPTNTGGVGHKYVIPLTEGVDYPEVEHVISPYTLGVLIAEGHLGGEKKKDGTYRDLTQITISNDDKFVLDKFINESGLSKDDMHIHKGTYSLDWSSQKSPRAKEMCEEIIRLGLNHTTMGKFIPNEYLIDSKANRMQLLAGLMDTDGTLEAPKNRSHYNTAFSTSSELLRDTFLTLIDSLGMGRSVYIDTHRKNQNYVITVFTPEHIWTNPKFDKKIEGREYRSSKHLYTQIMEIEEYGIDDSVCFTVDNEEHLFLINDFIVTHNTRQAMKDMLFVSATERYLPGYGTWQDLGPAVPTLMISTELNKTELQTIALAYITGLTTSQIEDGNFNVGEQERLEKGVEIIKKSNIKFVYIDDFSANDIQMLIEEHVMKYDTKIVVFDYIQSTPKLTRTLQDGYGHQLREDEVLAGLSRRLKFLAEKFDIFIMSATQLNAKSKDDSLFNSRDANAIRGSRAVVDKIDYGIILARPTPLDLKALSKSVGKEGFGDMTPDYATFVYKNRAGLDHIVLWSKNNLGNMNDQFMYATDYNYNLIDVKEIEAFVGYEEEYQEETNDEVVF